MDSATNIGKAFSPVSSTHRVRRLKKEDRDGRKRGFQGELEKEKDGKEEENQGGQVAGERGSANDFHRGKKAESAGGSRPGKAGSKKGGDEETVGTLVDITV